MRIFGVVFFLSSLFVFQSSCSSSKPDQEIVFEILDHYFEEKGEEQISKMLEGVIQKRRAQEPDSIQKRLREERVQIDVAGAPSRGSEAARILFVEYGDFLCPFTRVMRSVVSEWEQKYPGKIRRVFKNFPAAIRLEDSKPLAVAGLAAHRQGKFWEFYEAAFKKERDHDEKFYVDFAKKSGLNLEQFQADRKDPKLLEQVNKDLAEVEALSVPSTPSYYFNGVRLSGVQPLQNFIDVTENLLGETVGQ
jgi:protein-disulfide isomerase